MTLPMPPVATSVAATRQAVAAARRQGARIALVPTMGALHAGHTRLIEVANEQSDFVVVSIFVNPTQFGPQEDLAHYPRTFDTDRALCREHGVHLIFAPTPEGMYPAGFSTWVEVTELQASLCGLSRPGHFRGVCTVVLKLFNIVQPDLAVFGQKDYQQARMIDQMIKNLDLPLHLHIEATVREPDGLALSSRNRYLTPALRQDARVLYQALQAVQQQVAQGERAVPRLVEYLQSTIAAVPSARIDYAAIVDQVTLQPIDQLERPAVAAVAVYFDSTRLIDNVELTL